jgi:transposase
MQIMSDRYPAEQRERATRMALDRLDEYGSAWAVAHALGPKLGVGAETLRKWVVAQVDAGRRVGPTTDELAEIKRLKRENVELREANDILKAASIFFARELCATRRRVDRVGVGDRHRWAVAAAR